MVGMTVALVGHERVAGITEHSKISPYAMSSGCPLWLEPLLSTERGSHDTPDGNRLQCLRCTERKCEPVFSSSFVNLQGMPQTGQLNLVCDRIRKQ